MMNYRLIRTNRRTVALEITREGEVLVRAPLRMPQGEIDRFVSRHDQWAQKNLARMQARREAHPELTAAETEALAKAAMELLPARVAHFGGIMGLTPAGITITNARTRFGSCSPKNRLCFSVRLMTYPMEAIDYVVVHELAHIVHRNHGKDFYALVASVLPDYQARRAMLKE